MSLPENLITGDYVARKFRKDGAGVVYVKVDGMEDLDEKKQV